MPYIYKYLVPPPHVPILFVPFLPEPHHRWYKHTILVGTSGDGGCSKYVFEELLLSAHAQILDRYMDPIVAL